LFAGQPLIACADEIELRDDVDDLAVTCRLVSVKANLTAARVRMLSASGRYYTIDCLLAERPTENVLETDERFVVRVVPSPSTVSAAGLCMHGVF